MCRYLPHVPHFWLIGLILMIPLTGHTSTARTLEAPLPDTSATLQQQLLIGLLHSDFHTLAEEDRRGRRIGGYVLVGLGAASVAGGGATLAFGEGNEARTVGLALIGGGGALAGLSLIPFRVRSDTERLFAEFRDMPAEASADIYAKYTFGDRRYQELAQKRRTERLTGGIASLLVAGVSIFAVRHESAEVRVNAFVWPALGGVSNLLIRSEEERRYETYVQMREDIMRRGIH